MRAIVMASCPDQVSDVPEISSTERVDPLLDALSGSERLASPESAL
jgi:hypothetical protein